MNYCTFNDNMFEEKGGPVRSGGYQYVMTYSGGIKTIEQVLSFTIILCLFIYGQQPRTYFLFGVSVFSLLLAALFTILHISTNLERTYSPLYWIEFGFSLGIGLLFLLGATATWTVYTQYYIVVAVIGYVTAVVFLVDTVNQFQQAQSQHPRYVWTTPNMPA